ncbi:hypothetical protein LWC34_28535 [Kibdelosporangium philippinense]|uniref:Uncharacterized protein n=1 Tax=Kibdelosporangium philippinense TaxID=211113 RepID=A0ABS8ZII7_9PSEU|nr:hypothetical protein [Kibdelosporangium philippinense]MCE7006745.1 hypothetical protein [Kibdelosporangium philippinense]
MKLKTSRWVTITCAMTIAGLGFAGRPALASDNFISATFHGQGDYEAKADDSPGDGNKGWIWVYTSNYLAPAHVDYYLTNDNSMHTLQTSVQGKEGDSESFETFKDQAVRAIRVCGWRKLHNQCSNGGAFTWFKQFQ